MVAGARIASGSTGRLGAVVALEHAGLNAPAALARSLPVRDVATRVLRALAVLLTERRAVLAGARACRASAGHRQEAGRGHRHYDPQGRAPGHRRSSLAEEVRRRPYAPSRNRGVPRSRVASIRSI